MNILVFSPILSHPQNEGNCKRIFTLTKYLQTLGHTIHFVYFTQSGLSRNSFELMLNEWDTLTVIEKEIRVKRREGNYDLDEWYQGDIHDIVNTIIKTFNIQIVLLNYAMQSKLFEFLPNSILKILDTHDIFADRYLMYQDNNSPVYTWYSISKNDEIRALNRADIVIAIQNEEADYFSTVTDVPIKVINHLEEKHSITHSYSTLNKIGFLGSANQINDYSIHKFLDEFLKSPISDTTQIIIAGNICKKINTQHQNIILKGVVDNIEDFYSDVDLVITPLTFGTGLKIKSIEALSFGVPIISTKIGFEGIESQHKCHQMDTLTEMVECINSIYKAPSKLLELEKLSKTIFDAYESKVKHDVQNIFKIQTLDKVLTVHDTHQSLKEKEKIIYQQHKQIQIDAFNQKEYKKKIEKQQQVLMGLKNKEIQDLKKFEKQQKNLMDLIRETTKLSLVGHPIKKYKAYKSMLKVYFKIRKKNS